MDRELMYKLNLQFFADDQTDDKSDDKVDDKTNDDSDDGADDDTDKAKYTEAEYKDKLEKELARRMKQKEKEKADAVEEAKKLEKMNAQQKQEYELEQLKAKNAEYERQINLNNMSKEASKMMTEAGITPSDDVLQFVTSETAEETQKRVEAFSTAVNNEVQKQVAEKLRGGAPKGNPSNPNSKKALKDYSYAELSELKEKHPAQYAELTKNN